MMPMNHHRMPRSLAFLLIMSSCCHQLRHDDANSSEMHRRTALHAGGIWGVMMPMPAVVAAEEQVPVEWDVVDNNAHEEEKEEEEEEQKQNFSQAADIGSGETAVTREEEERKEEHDVPEQAMPGEETDVPTAKTAREAHNAQLQKKGVPFGGFAGTATDTNTSTTTTTTTTISQIRKDDVIPPDGFVLASRVVSIDGLSYFVDSDGDKAHAQSDAGAALISPPLVLGDLSIPFLDCGAVGSFTDAIGMRDCSFRHLPSGAEPFGWSTVDTPQLVVALQPLEVTVSGGGGDDGMEATRRNFRAGDVLLFEDTDGKGHKMKAAPVKKKGATGGKPAPTPSFNPDMSVLIISLPPQKRYSSSHRARTGANSGPGNGGSKDKTSVRLPVLFGKRKNPNKEGDSVSGDPPRPCLVETDGTYSSLGPPASQTLSDVLPSPGRFIRGTVGAVISALVTDRWLGRGEPRIAGWLGGCALVVGGTCGFAAVGEGTLEGLADWWEEFVINRKFTNGEDGDEAVSDGEDGDLDLDGLKEEIKEEILPTLIAGRNSSDERL